MEQETKRAIVGSVPEALQTLASAFRPANDLIRASGGVGLSLEIVFDPHSKDKRPLIKGIATYRSDAGDYSFKADAASGFDFDEVVAELHRRIRRATAIFTKQIAPPVVDETPVEFVDAPPVD